MCYPDRVEGPHFVPGLPHVVAGRPDAARALLLRGPSIARLPSSDFPVSRYLRDAKISFCRLFGFFSASEKISENRFRVF